MNQITGWAVPDRTGTCPASQGAEIIWTNSFGGSPLCLAAHGLANRTEEVNLSAARIAREAAGNDAWVAGSVGPCGSFLPPGGDLGPEEFTKNARRQIGALIEGGVDAIAIETMMDVEEAVLAIRAAKEVAPAILIFATLTFKETKNGLFTPFGNSPADAAARLGREGADLIGANCGTGPEPMLRVAREMRAATDRPLIFRPNAGMPRATGAGTEWPETPESFARAVHDLKEIDAALVGGCCGTTPAHIRAIRLQGR